MQRIERYGVIALVFLLVTVAAVSFWGEGRDTEKGLGDESVARAASPLTPTPRRPREGRKENARESESTLPMSARGGTQRPRPRAEIVEIPETAAAPAVDERAAPAPEPVSEPPALNTEWPERITGRGTRTAPGTQRPVEERPRSLPSQPRSSTPPAQSPTPPASTPRNQPSAVTDGTYVWHDVQPSETLSEIAQERLGKASRWREIQAMNAGLTPESLRSGTRIKIPSDGAVRGGGSQPSQPRPREPRSEAGRVYVVKSGDTLSGIASRELGDVGRMAEIVALNPGMNPDVVVLGASLQMPAGARPERSIAQATPPAASEPRRETRNGPRVR